jgi:hypothetical protein
VVAPCQGVSGGVSPKKEGSAYVSPSCLFSDRFESRFCPLSRFNIHEQSNCEQSQKHQHVLFSITCPDSASFVFQILAPACHHRKVGKLKAEAHLPPRSHLGRYIRALISPHIAALPVTCAQSVYLPGRICPPSLVAGLRWRSLAWQPVSRFFVLWLFLFSFLCFLPPSSPCLSYCTAHGVTQSPSCHMQRAP